MAATTKAELAAQIRRLRKSFGRAKAKNAALGKSLAEAHEQRAATSEILRVISRSPADVQPVFDAIVRRALRLIGGHSAAVTRLADGMLHLGALTSTSKAGDAVARSGFPRPISKGTNHDRAIRTKAVCMTPDTEKVPRSLAALKELGRARGFRSSLAVPLLRDGAAIGAIGVTRKQRGSFSKRQIDLLQTFAHQAVIAIENVRLFSETKEALERQTATAEILKVIAGSPSDVQPVFDAIARSARQLTGGISAAVVRLVGDTLHLAALTTTSESGDEALRGRFPAPVSRGGMLANAVLTRAPACVCDIEAELEVSPAFREMARARGFRSALAVPMMHDGAVIGTLSVTRKEAGPFSGHQVELLKTFADQAVIAIENVRLFNETKEALERQTASAEILKVISSSPTDTQPVFDAIADSCLRLFSGMTVVLVLRRGDVIDRAAYAGIPELKPTDDLWPLPLDDQVVSGRAILRGELVHIPDVSSESWVGARSKEAAARVGYRSMICAPMMREGGAIGAINVVRAEPGAFDDKRIALLRTFADQAVIAIENVRLFNETKEALERQTATAEILKVISSSPTNVQPVFEAIAQRAALLSAGKFAYVTAFDGEWIHLRATYGPDSAEHVARYPIRPGSDAVSARVVRDRAPVQIADVLDDAEYAHKEAAKVTGFRSAFGVPMMRDGHVLGAIVVARPEPGAIAEKLIRLLQTFADQAVIAIENVRLFNETKEALERQTATAEILKVISSSPTDTQPVFEAIARSVVRLCDGLYAFLGLFDGTMLSFVAFQNVNPEALAIIRKAFPSPPTRGSTSGRAILDRAAVHIPDVSADAEYQMSDLARAQGYNAMLAVPMLRERTPIGVITVGRKAAFSENQMELVKTFADQAVIAIENVRLFNETKEALERQTATSEILRAMSGSLTEIAPVFDSILENAIRLCEGDAAVLWQYDGRVLRLAAGKNTTQEATAYLHEHPLELGRYNPTPLAGLERRTIHVLDVFAEPGYRPLVPPGTTTYRPNAPTVLAVPLLRENDLLGVITIWRYEKRLFTEKQVEMVNTFAAQAVIAIENVRLFKETKEALERQTATGEILSSMSGSMTDTGPVFDAIVRNLLRLFGTRFAAVFLLRDEKIELAGFEGEPGFEKLVEAYPVPLDERTIAGKGILTGQVLQFAPVVGNPAAPPFTEQLARQFGYDSLITAPMVREGRSIGAIATAHRDAVPFNDKEVALIKSFADQAVIAIENVRLFNETKEALERQTATAEILKVISSSPTDIQPVLDAVAANAARLCDASDAMIQLREGNVFRFAAHHGTIPNMPLGATREISRELVTGRAFLEGRQIHVHDLQSETEDYPQGSVIAKQFGYRTILVTPLMREGTAIGTIMVRRTEALPFSDSHLALVKTFADQAVIAIENVRMFNETKEALERQTATAEILKVISGSPTDVRPVFEAIARSAVAICGSTGAAVFRYDGELLDFAAGHNTSREQAELMAQKYPMRPDRSQMAGRVILSRSVIRMEDALSDPDYDQRFAIAGGWRRVLGVPMLREGNPIGAIVVRWTEPGPIPMVQEELLKTFADQAVIAIENVRLFNETKEALERQTATGEVLKAISRTTFDLDAVLRVLIENATRLAGANKGFIFRIEGEVARLAVSHNAPPAYVALMEANPIPPGRGSLVGRTLLDRRPTHIPDALADSEFSWHEAQRLGGFRSMLGVPMMREGSPIGVIAMWSDEVKPFSEKQIELVTTFADQAVIAIENVRLFNETKEALERQTATAEILKVISSSPRDLQPVFDAILEKAMHLCEAHLGFLGLYDGDKYEHVAQSGVSPEYAKWISRGPFVPDPRMSIVRMIRERKAVHHHDLRESPGYREGVEPVVKTVELAGARTLLAVPMLKEARVVGGIVIFRPEVRPFTQKQIDLVSTFANQAVIAIENVRLFKELEARTEALTRSVGQLTALGEVGQAISSTLDLETVLQTIVARAVQLTGLDGGAIYEYDEHSEQFRLRAAESIDEETVEILRSNPIRKGDGAVGTTAVTREPIQIPETHDESYRSRLREILIRTGRRALLAVPLVREDHVIGALAVQRNTPGPFAPEIVELLKTFATQSAMAIQNARLFREIAEKGRQLEVASRHKSDFLASMSHELRTPLNAILGFNEMLLGQVYGELPADMQAPLAQMQTSGKHLLRLINNVLDLAKIEAGRMELALSDYSVQDAVESVRSTLRPLAAEKGLEFLATVPADIPLAFGDPGRIAQCLMNLAGNSLKFTKAGKVEISVEQRDGLLRYCVADTGIGIAPDKLETVFAEFKQTDATIASEYGGTGLGLSISRKFVEMHGGRIWVESEIGKGSTFIFEIPLRAGAGAQA